MNAHITIGKNTSGHAATLRSLGFAVSEAPGRIEIEADRQGDVKVADVAGLKATIKAMVVGKKLFSYKDRVSVGDRTMFSTPLCGYLEGVATGLSAFVANFPVSSARTVSSTLAAFLAD